MDCKAVSCATVPLLMEVPSAAVAIEWALAFLGCMHRLVQRPCIVLDIDGTVLLNEEDGSSKCVLPFQGLCQACEESNISVHCVTARQEDDDNRAYTRRQLEKCKLHNIDKLYMREPGDDPGEYKFEARRDITQQGYSILLTFGDQYFDLTRSARPPAIKGDRIYVGQMADDGQFGVKLPSEF